MSTWNAVKSAGLCLAVLLASVPALASVTTPDPALRYQVVDVAADDRLNVREHAGIEADIVGTLPPDGDGVVITGAAMEVAGSQWWEIVFSAAERGSGWVNGRYLEVMDRDERERDYPMQCAGTEPFWSLELADGEAIYSDPHGETQIMSAGKWRKASGMFGHFAVELEHEGGIGYAAISRQRFYCSDGMSDIRYPFDTLLIRPDGEVFAGCCRRSR